jgi:hypothetical protein
MNVLAKQYRGLLGASLFALLSVSGSGFFLWQSFERSANAVLELEKRKKEFESLRTGNPGPTEENLKQLEEQKKNSISSVEKLRSKMTSMNIPLEKIQPDQFQSALNTKTQAFIAKAAKNRIPIPRGAESDDFAMDFDKFIKRVPSEDKVSAVNKQLAAADHLLNSLIDSRPIALLAFNIDRASEESKEAKPEPKTDSKPGKPNQPQPKPSSPVLSILGFDLKFTASPDSLRDFVNGLTRDNKAFYVIRRIKVTTLSKDEVPMLAPSKNPVTNPAESPAVGQPQAAPVAQYIVGEEHVEAEMRVDLITTLPPPEPNPTADKSSKPTAKEGAKQP